MPGSPIVITYDGTDISGSCVFSLCTFEAQMAAVPGTFTVVVRDQPQTLSFTTGKHLTLTVDGDLLYGGYVTQVTKKNFFPADDTTVVADVETRQWLLQGVDWNALMDKRVLRNTSDYTHHIPKVAGPVTDGEVIRSYFDLYFDIPSGFNFTSATYVKNKHTYGTRYRWPTQGLTMREVLEDLARYGSVYWISADKQFNFIPVQDTLADWGFSDDPNNDPIGIGTPTYGFRDGEFIEDASTTVNDAIVWGGSEWTSGGEVVFARRQNTPSITAHERWQISENNVGDDKYLIQAEVTARAKVIVDGNESGTFVEGSKGLVNPERQFRCTWFSTNVPKSGGNPVHLVPGQVVPIRLRVFSEDAGVTPFAVDLPLRQLTITFPDLDPGGDAYAQFDGHFGVLMSDPHYLWAFLRGAKTRTKQSTVTSSATNTTVDPGVGAQYQDEPSPATNGVTNVFFIPFGYIAGTLQLYVNGLLQEGSAFSESNPSGGEITLTFVPHVDDRLFVEATLS